MSCQNNTQPDTNHNNDQEPQNMLSLELYPAPTMRRLRWRVALEATCALIATAMVVAGFVLSHNGVLPAWLDAHGRYAWMGAGAAGVVLLFAVWPSALENAYAALDEYRFARDMNALEELVCRPPAGVSDTTETDISTGCDLDGGK